MSNSSSMTASALLFFLKGRIPRSTYWLKYAVPFAVILVVLILIDFAAGTFDEEWAIAVFSAIFVVLALYPSIAVSLKRCHDRNRPVWFLLLAFIPLANLWVLVVFRHILPGNALEIFKENDPSFVRLLIATFFGAGLMEELINALPVFTGAILSSRWLNLKNDFLSIQLAS